ncbi:MAG: hypothetical protein GYA24_04100, partial [Candidatus Lokiarchaeota archaeon]|nr:hypothetical protein [Candidatus Lokiarchaeota archaeon]
MSAHKNNPSGRCIGPLTRALPALLLLNVLASCLAGSLPGTHVMQPSSQDGSRAAPGEIASSPAVDDPVLAGGAYGTSTAARFDVVENVTSMLYKRDFQAVSSNSHNISTPTSWQIDTTNLAIQPYYKVQKIVDPTITAPANVQWIPRLSNTGTGTLVQSFQPSPSTPQYVQTYIKNLLYSPTSPAFKKDDYALWEQKEKVQNTNGNPVIEGALYQKRSQNLENFGSFLTNPNFATDLNAPYGGVNRPDDEISLVYDATARALVVNMLPATTVLGGNPSAAWWNTITIPYEADYVQMKVSWSIDPASTFEAVDSYQVCARVNNEYIDGRPVSSGGMMIANDDILPYQGSTTSLITYNNPLILNHNRITRTYNVTRLVNGLVGVNKIDFGAWCSNPTHAGDPDRIIARFHYIEIAYNTSDKFEVARLEFDYQCISNLTGNVGTVPAAFLAVNRASIFMKLEDSDDTRLVRLLPFKNMTVYRTGTPGMQWIRVNTSISQKFKDFLARDSFKVSIGVIFEKDYYEPANQVLWLDNVYLQINYAYPTFSTAQLQLSVDGSPWTPLSSNITTVPTGSWIPGQDHAFRFQSMNPSYGSQTFLNFHSVFVAHQFVLVPNAAIASYAIAAANDPRGTWTITYNNTVTFDPLLILNATMGFNLSVYSISVLNMPAFDGKGSTSTNWRVIAAYNPASGNVSSSAERFNYTANPMLQSVRIGQSLAAGVWTVIATQPNYITGVNFVDATSYLGTPAYYKGTRLNFTFSLWESVAAGNYSIALLNGSGAVLAGFPLRGGTTGQAIPGDVLLSTGYPVGKYYMELRWNDTAAVPGTAMRLGSARSAFYILNATVAGFLSTTPSVQSGTTANFTIYYRTTEALPITGATLAVLENSTGTYKLWGTSWMGSYQVGPITNPSPGEYAVPLYTSGAPSGNYQLIFFIQKLYHQPRNLTTALGITTSSQVVASISAGATWNGSAYNLNPDNIPYVNDTINSRVQVYITQQGTGTPVQDGLVIGRIGTAGNYVAAIEIFKITNLPADKGKYNLTLDTTGLNATAPGSSTKLYITCSASGYNPGSVNVTMTIAPCPTLTGLNPISSINEGGSASLVATLFTLVNPSAPKPHNFGTLTYFIYRGATQVKTGVLAFLASGVYTSMVSMDGLDAGNYTALVHASAFNCQPSASANVSFTILPRLTTDLTLVLPDSIRIMKPFQARATLTYLVNGTAIPGKTVAMNIVIGTAINFMITATTDAAGTVTYDYIIDPRYFNETITITAEFPGDACLAPSTDTAARTILDRIPIAMTITISPASLRTGYPASYTLQINITDLGESLLNRLIVLVAWYENDRLSPFLTMQLRTDINGITTYTIPEIEDGFRNMTIIFEYQGSTTVAYNTTQLTQDILPKWTSNFTIAPLPSIIRFGQAIHFSLNFTCENASISLVGLPVVFTFLYGINPSSTSYVQAGNALTFAYSIPDGIGDSLNVSISFPGTSKIAGHEQVLTLSISPKIQVVLAFAEPVRTSYMTGKYLFSVRSTDASGTPLQGLLIQFSIGGQQQVVATNVEGIASVSIDLNDVGNNIIMHVRFIEAAEYAGATIDSIPFRVLDEWLYFLDLLPYIGIACAIILAIAISIHRGVVVPRRNRARASLSKMYQRLSDVENVQYLLVISKNGGVPMFSKSLAEVPIDESLVSGFLSAISSFGAEISTKMKGDLKGGLEELSYQQFKIILHEGQFVRVALLLLRRPSDTLKERLRGFTTEFEKRFRAQVENFKGEVLQDMVVTPVIEQTFESDLLYPHRLIDQKIPAYAKELPRKSVAKKVLAVAKGEGFESSFYVRELVNHLKTKGIEEILTFDAVQKLKADQVVFAINPRTNYIIEQLKPYIKMLTADDRAALFAIYENNTDGMSMQKFF